MYFFLCILDCWILLVVLFTFEFSRCRCFIIFVNFRFFGLLSFVSFSSCMSLQFLPFEILSVVVLSVFLCLFFSLHPASNYFLCSSWF